MVSLRPAIRAAFASYFRRRYGPVEEIEPAQAPGIAGRRVLVIDCVGMPSAFTYLEGLMPRERENPTLALVSRPSDLAEARARSMGLRGILSDLDAIPGWALVLGGIDRLAFQAGPSFDSVTPVAALLTPRQRDVYRLVISGMSDCEVANALEISEATAETHRRNVQVKLACGGHRELMMHAIRHGIADGWDVPVRSILRRATRSHSAKERR